MKDTEREYDHTQNAPLHWMLTAMAVAAAATAIIWFNEPVLLWATVPSSVLLFFLAQSFKFLSVTDQGTFLSVRFGPVPLLGTALRYDEIVGVEATRSGVLDGWGVHWMPGRGWIYNLWGFDCVRVRLKHKTVRIGTDDVAGLIAFLNRRIAMND